MKVNSYAEKKETGTLASHGLMTAEASIIARIHVQRICRHMALEIN